MRVFVISVVLMLPALASAADFTAVQYECGQMQPERDGIRCALANIEGQGATLLIRVHARETSPAALRKRAQYLVRKTMDAFLVVGGTWIIQRATLPGGRVNERMCSRTRGRLTEQCEEWDKADKDNNALFKPIDPAQ